MLPSARALRRPFKVSLRPSQQIRCSPDSRLFTQNSQLLLLSSNTVRPQLPFLHPTNLRPLPRNRFQIQLARVLSTETKIFLKDTAKGVARITAYFWTIAALLLVAKFGLDNEILERAYPSPPDWSWISRWKLRTAKGQEHPDEHGSGLTDWASTGNLYRQIIERLEDPAIDGKGVRAQLGEGEEIYVEGVGKTGLDISAQPEPWRRGYHDALMGAARAAEHLDTWVRDKIRNVAFPPEVVIGPSNPRPKPVPYGAKSAPKEEDCEPAFEPPHVYYMKVLTTHGFTSRQRLDAALAYADWLRYKGLNDSAEDMYSWALDIAVAGTPNGHNVINKKTGVINDKVDNISSNLLLATKHLAIHHAQTGNFSAALPIFLSLLRTQQSLPPPATPNRTTPLSKTPSNPLVDTMKTLIFPPSFPPAPPSGDEPATRTASSICTEAGTMTHIGEILFASSSSSSPSFSTEPTGLQSAGLSWTRQAMDLAEDTLRSMSALSAPKRPESPEHSSLKRNFAFSSYEEQQEAKTRCAECLTSGMQNWSKMIGKFERAEISARNERLRKENDASKVVQVEGKGSHTGWFWGGGNSSTASPPVVPVENGADKWEEEAKRVGERHRRIRRLLREEEVGG